MVWKLGYFNIQATAGELSINFGDILLKQLYNQFQSWYLVVMGLASTSFSHTLQLHVDLKWHAPLWRKGQTLCFLNTPIGTHRPHKHLCKPHSHQHCQPKSTLICFDLHAKKHRSCQGSTVCVYLLHGLKTDCVAWDRFSGRDVGSRLQDNVPDAIKQNYESNNSEATRSSVPVCVNMCITGIFVFPNLAYHSYMRIFPDDMTPGYIPCNSFYCSDSCSWLTCFFFWQLHLFIPSFTSILAGYAGVCGVLPITSMLWTSLIQVAMVTHLSPVQVLRMTSDCG